MNTRVEPTVGSLDGIEITDPPIDLLAQAHAVINAHVSVASEDVTEAQKVGLSPAIAKAEARLEKALRQAAEAAEVLSAAYQAEGLKFAASQAYVQDRPEVGASKFKAAAEGWRAIKGRAVDVAFSASDMPGELWDKVAKRVNNSLTQAIESAGENVAARKEQAKGWANRVGRSIDKTVDRLEAIPGQIAEYAAVKGVALKTAALSVVVTFLRWGAKKEAAIREKFTAAASLGEAALKTSADLGRGLVDQVKSVGKTFETNAEVARARRSKTP